MQTARVIKNYFLSTNAWVKVVVDDDDGEPGLGVESLGLPVLPRVLSPFRRYPTLTRLEGRKEGRKREGWFFKPQNSKLW